MRQNIHLKKSTEWPDQLTFDHFAYSGFTLELLNYNYTAFDINNHEKIFLSMNILELYFQQIMLLVVGMHWV